MNQRLTRLVAVVVLGGVSAGAHAESIVLNSGNGIVGTADSQITYFSPGDGAIGPFTTADFAAAVSGPHATVVNAYPAWVGSLPSAPTAKWIAVNSSDAPRSALYAYSFMVNSTSIGSASMTMSYAVDNNLGQSSVPGVYLNGSPVNGAGSNGSFTSISTFTDNDIASLLKPGLNTLYFYQYDFGVVAGSIFDATINVSPIPTPLPASLWLLIGGLGAAGALRRTKAH